MSDINEIKGRGQTIVMVGVSIGETICETLQKFFEAYKATGDKSLKEFIKTLEGKRFNDEGKFMLHAKNQSEGVTEVAVSKSELKEFQKLCKNYGVDFHYQKRPPNLEDLFQRKEAGETLSENQTNIVNTFTIYDENGKPHLKPDGALISFMERDLKTMEKVVDKLEERTFNIQKRKIKAQNIINKAKKAKEGFGKTVDKAVSKSK